MATHHTRLATVKRSAILTLALAAVQPHARASGNFYEEPLQTLADYLRLDQWPAKSIAQVLAETGQPAAPAVKIDFQAELLALPKKPGAEALASLDKMLAAARAAADTPLLNLLHDVRDLFAGPATAAESAEYLEWRVTMADRFGVSFDKPKAAEPEPEREHPGPNPAFNAEIERQLAKASPALKPHWLYLRAAADWLGGKIPESQTRFLKVAADFPKHPRAETAMLMALRGAIWKTRKPAYTQTDRQLDEGERVQAKKLFDEYFAKYPHGRFYGDALGWRGALAWDGGDYATALRCYAEQLDLPGHPELFDSAAVMIEKTLSRLSAEPRNAALAEVARHPAAAQALAYLVLNTSESDNYNGKFDSVDEVRGWRKKVLPRLAAAISGEQKLYAGAEWKPRYLAMLAGAASGAGQHEQALKLIESAGAAVEKSDDLLFARGVALHRAKRAGEAAAVLQTLLAKFPQSPLARGARLRLGLALTDDHRGGEAVLALDKLVPKPPAADAQPKDGDPASEAALEHERLLNETRPDSGDYPMLFGIDVNQVRALIDTLLNFAPIAELAAPTQDAKLDPVARLRFTEAIAQRLLAREQFDEAKKYLTPAQWELFAGPLARLTKAAQDAKEPAARAAACRKLGDAWAAARGKLLTYPLDTDETRREVFIDFWAEANVRRAASAPFVGATGNVAPDLEGRDELRHAFAWWLEASDAQPGTPQTAQALWLALRAMPLIADVSPFTFERAVARKWSDTARRLYDRLRTECPASTEAQRLAVAWDFSAPKKRAKTPDDDGEEGGHRDAAGERMRGMDVLKAAEKESVQGSAAEGLVAQIDALEKDAGAGNPAKLKARVEALRAKARKAFIGWNELRWVNLLDDLALFFSEPDPGTEVRERYVKLRFRFVRESAIGGGGFEEKPKADEELGAAIKTALADPAVQSVADYFEFLNLAVVANHFIFVKLNGKDKGGDADTYRTHDYPQLAKLAAAFLEKHPQSKKREAALLLHARAVFQSSKEVAARKYVTWPQAGRCEGGIETSVTSQEPFDAKRVLAALDGYDRAFPHGRYAADIRDCRAAVALRMRDWQTALELTVAQFDDKDAGALFTSAANRLGEIFAQLAEEKYRADLLPVVRANARGRELLAKYLADESDAHPLRYMKAWLREQLAAK